MVASSLYILMGFGKPSKLSVGPSFVAIAGGVRRSVWELFGRNMCDKLQVNDRSYYPMSFFSEGRILES